MRVGTRRSRKIGQGLFQQGDGLIDLFQHHGVRLNAGASVEFVLFLVIQRQVPVLFPRLLICARCLRQRSSRRNRQDADE